MFMVVLGLVVVNLRASRPSHMTPKVCGSHHDVELYAGGTSYHPEDLPLKGEPTTWKLKHHNECLLDLHAYESMKVGELRSLLRTRKCNAEGKKEVLIGRLVAVYQAELTTMTVQQLRPKLRSKGCMQGGKKVELIHRLVEAGL
jgi:hypothetical protein